MSNNIFRTDINGLRAIAVITVVLFHFKLKGFEGGFVGVDIFFVISGFLMTGIIVKGIENSSVRKFSIFDFYVARARRIIPALFVLCLILFILGWFLLAPDDYVKLSREADRALLFLSNNYYYKNSGYFDTDSHERMLLHTWSLSIEWQFYILYPLFLVLLSKLGLRKLPYTLLVVLLASFAWSVHKSYADPNYAFYMLPSRAWEMLLGGLVFYLSRTQILEKYKRHLFYLGFVFIAFSVFYYDASVRWPGVAALVPTLGTALIIFSAQQHILMSNIVSEKLGNWSYSIYLWHWPLVVTLFLIGIDGFTWLSVVFIFISVLFGWLSFILIENPLRNYFSKKSNWITLIIIVLALATILLPAEKIRKSKGYMQRIDVDVYQVLNAENDKFYDMYKCHDKRNINNKNCFYGEGELGVIVLGDSHAMSFMPLVVDTYRGLGIGVLDFTASGCPALKGVKSSESKQCDGFFENSLVQINKHPGLPVYVSNRYSAALLGGNEEDAKDKPNLYFDNTYSDFNDDYTSKVYSSYVDSICTLAKSNPVYMFRPVPELIKHVPKTMGRAMLYRDEKVRVSVTREYYETRNMLANKIIDELADRCGVVPLEVAEYFCDDEHCYGDVDGLPVYFDDDHLNTKGALLLKDELLKHINTSAQ